MPSNQLLILSGDRDIDLVDSLDSRELHWVFYLTVRLEGHDVSLLHCQISSISPSDGLGVL